MISKASGVYKQMKWRDQRGVMRLAVTLFVLFISVVFGSRSFATVSGAQTVTLDGRLTNAAGDQPLLDASVVIDIKIMAATGGCILYEESQHVDTTSTEGRFTIQVGSAVGDAKRVSGYTLPMTTIFQNAAMITSASCSYTPASGDGRILRVTISPSTTGTVEVLSPDTLIDTVPNALVAETLQGLDRDHVLAIDSTTTLSQSNVANIFSSTNYPALTALLGGTSSQYVSSSASGGAKIPAVSTVPTSPSTGQIWFNSSANAFQYYNGSAVQTLGVAGTGISALTVGSSLTANGTAGGTLNSSGTIDIVNSGVTAGTYSKVSVNSKGFVTYGTGLVESDIPTLSSPGHVIGDAITSGTIGGNTAFYSSGNVTTSGTVQATYLSSTYDTTRKLTIYGTGSSYGLSMTAPTMGANYSLVFPAVQGAAGSTLVNDGTGNLSWVASSSGSVTSVGLVLPSIFNVTNPVVTSTGNLSAALANQNANLIFAGPASGGAGAPTFRGLAVADLPAGYDSTVQKNSLASGKIWIGNSSGVASAVSPFGDVLLSLAGSATVSQIQGVPVSATAPITAGQVLRWNGSSWAPNFVAMSDLRSTITGASYLTSCASNQTLVFSSASDSLICTSISIASSQVVWGSTGANLVFAGPSTGGGASPTFRFLTLADLPSGSVSQWNSVSTTINYLAGFVGIGTATPQALLDLYGTGSASAMLVPRDTQSARPTGINGMIRYNTSSNAVETFANGAWTTLATAASGASQWTSSGSNIYYSSGNVGIGTNSPNFALDMNVGTTSNGGINLTGSGVGGPRIVLNNTNGTAANRSVGLNLQSNSTLQYSVGLRSGDGHFYVYDEFAGAPAIDISASGAGTRINSAIKTEGSYTNSYSSTAMPLSPQLELQNDGGSDLNTSLIHFAPNNSANHYQQAWFGAVATTNNYTPAIVLGQQVGVSGYSERMRIDTNGYVGIGSTAPQTLLDLNGTGAASAILLPRDTTTGRPAGVNGMLRYNTSNAQVETYSSGAWSGLATAAAVASGASQWTSSGGNIFYNSTGNVGIGSSSPSVKLDINGSTNVNGTLNTGPANFQGVMSVGYFGASVSYNGSNVFSIWGNPTGGSAYVMTVGGGNPTTSAYLMKYTNSVGTIGWTDMAGNMYVSGNLGVGTATAAATLDVYGTGAQSAMLVPRDSTANRPTGVNGMLRYNTSLQQLETYSSGAWAGLSGASGSSSSQWTTSGANIYYNSSTGNVGIGTASPSAPLHIANGTSAGITLQKTGSPSGTFNIFDDGDAHFESGSNKIWFNGYGSGPIYLAAAGGAVGIGTNSAIANLDLYAANATFDLRNSGDSVGVYMQDTYTSGQFGMVNPTGSAVGVIGANSYRALFAYDTSGKVGSVTNGNNAAAIYRNLLDDGSGKMGVGTSAPAALLDVYGSGSNSAILVPRATIAQRPTSPVNGMIRYQIDGQALETYVAGTWTTIATALAGASQWITSSTTIYYNAGSVGIGTATPASLLDVNGEVRMHNSGTTCSSTIEGAQRYNSTAKRMEVCSTQNGSYNWVSVGNAPGTITATGSATCPNGSLLANGTSYAATTYPALCLALLNAEGGTSNAACTSGNFNVPDLRGRFLRGVDGGVGNDPDASSRTAMNSGGNTGNNVGSVQADQYASHNHTLTDPGHVHAISDPGHNHTLTDPGHGHIENIYNGAANTGGGGYPSVADKNNNGIMGTYTNATSSGVIANATTGISLAAATTGITVTSHTTGITLATSGGNETRAKNAYVNYCIYY